MASETDNGPQKYDISGLSAWQRKKMSAQIGPQDYVERFRHYDVGALPDTQPPTSPYLSSERGLVDKAIYLLDETILGVTFGIIQNESKVVDPDPENGGYAEYFEFSYTRVHLAVTKEGKHDIYISNGIQVHKGRVVGNRILPGTPVSNAYFAHCLSYHAYSREPLKDGQRPGGDYPSLTPLE
jgi:hypothetical protein